jgi:hypothetical protein
MKGILFAAAALFCLLNIVLWPVTKYEWMLLDDPGMSLPIDDNTAFYSLLAVLPVAVLAFSCFMAKSGKGKRIILLVTLALLGVWAYKFGHAILLESGRA